MNEGREMLLRTKCHTGGVIAINSSSRTNRKVFQASDHFKVSSHGLNTKGLIF